MRADLRVLTLRLPSCVYRFPLHLLGLQSESTEELSTEGRTKKPQEIHVKKHVNTSVLQLFDIVWHYTGSEAASTFKFVLADDRMLAA